MKTKFLNTTKRACLLSCMLFLFLVDSPPAITEPLVARSRSGMVVSTSSLASDVGANILEQGGNAVDAAIATAFALSVTHPQAGNLGGGGFMIIQPPLGDAVAIDYRETAPAKTTSTLFVGDDGHIDTTLIRGGVLASGIPGTVRGLELAHKKFGSLPWKSLVLPAVSLARNGFVLPEDLANSLNKTLQGEMGQFPTSVKAYGKPGGGSWSAGDRIVLPDLARTLHSIAEKGPGAFYTGWIAEKIVAQMESMGGIMTKSDLAGYKAIQRVPVRGSFLAYEIISMPPPSSGGVALIEMLNILEEMGIQKMPASDPDTLHLLAEVMRHAFLDRARFLGDPDFVSVPVDRLIGKKHAKELAAGIRPHRAGDSVALGKEIMHRKLPKESNDTTHFSVLDGSGMGVANTYTLEASYGGKVVVDGAGFLLNNEMGDFNRKPGMTDTRGNIGTLPNVAAPGKRMLSSMTPTIVRTNGKILLITGSPGGRTIINTVLRVVLNVTAFGMDGESAVNEPRIHHQWLPDRILAEETLPREVIEKLKRMGHQVLLKEAQGDAHSIWVDSKTGFATGVADGRRSQDAKAASPSP